MNTHVTGFDFFLSQIQANLRPLTQEFFNTAFTLYQTQIGTLEHALTEAARKQTNEEKKTLFIDAIEQIRLHQVQLRHTFTFYFVESLQILSGENTAQLSSAQIEHNYQQLNDATRQDKLCLKQATDECNARNHSTLEKLHTRTEQILAITLEPSLSPFNPVHISHAIFSAWQTFTLHSSIKQVIFTAFADNFYPQLDALYQRILQHMQSIATHSNASERINNDDIIDINFNEQLMHGVIAADFSGAPYLPMQSASANLLSTKALLALLNSMQKGFDPNTDGLLIQHIKQRLLMDADTKTSALNLRDENLINLFGLCFQQIAHTSAGRNKELFLRLSLPFIRRVLQDEYFLHHAEHPGRIFLNRLVALSVRNLDDALVYKQLQFYTTKVLMRFKEDDNFFSTLNQELLQQLNLYPALDWPSQAQLTKQFEQEETQRLRQRTVNAISLQLCRNISKPLLLHRLFDFFIQEILLHSLNKENNKQHFTSTQLFLQQFSYLLDEQNKHFTSALQQSASLCKAFNQKLDEAGVNTQYQHYFFEALHALLALFQQKKSLKQIYNEQLPHSQALNTIIGHYETLYAQNLFEKFTVGQGNKQKNTIVISQKDAEQQVQKLTIGQWLNVVIDEQATPCFLGYFNAEKERYVFYDRRMQKLFKREKAELIADFQHGFAYTFHYTQSFDDALRFVITQLHAPS